MAKKTTAAKKKAAKKTTTAKQKTAKKTTAAKKKASNSRKKAANKPISADQRNRMIAEAAYYNAERRGFIGGNDVQDWLDAEAQVDARLK